MYSTKKIVYISVRDDNGRLVDFGNIGREKAYDLPKIEKSMIDNIYKVDDMLGREHKNLHTEISTITVRA